jgi:threonine aldolase
MKVQDKLKFIDFRSDVKTIPTKAMRDAMYTCEVGDSVLLEDPTQLELEKLGAEIVGKEAALFVPTGCFGNQLSIVYNRAIFPNIIVSIYKCIYFYFC